MYIFYRVQKYNCKMKMHYVIGIKEEIFKVAPLLYGFIPHSRGVFNITKIYQFQI